MGLGAKAPGPPRRGGQHMGRQWSRPSEAAVDRGPQRLERLRSPDLSHVRKQIRKENICVRSLQTTVPSPLQVHRGGTVSRLIENSRALVRGPGRMRGLTPVRQTREGGCSRLGVGFAAAPESSGVRPRCRLQDRA